VPQIPQSALATSLFRQVGVPRTPQAALAMSSQFRRAGVPQTPQAFAPKRARTDAAVQTLAPKRARTDAGGAPSDSGEVLADEDAGGDAGARTGETFVVAGLPKCETEEAAELFGYYLAQFFNAHTEIFGLSDVQSEAGVDEADPKATVLSAGGAKIARIAGHSRVCTHQRPDGSRRRSMRNPTAHCSLLMDDFGTPSDFVDMLTAWAEENLFSFELDGVVQSKQISFKVLGQAS